ncbi:unnamed protein product [Prunus armeniaca]
MVPPLGGTPTSFMILEHLNFLHGIRARLHVLGPTATLTPTSPNICCPHIRLESSPYMRGRVDRCLSHIEKLRDLAWVNKELGRKNEEGDDRRKGMRKKEEGRKGNLPSPSPRIGAAARI